MQNSFSPKVMPMDTFDFVSGAFPINVCFLRFNWLHINIFFEYFLLRLVPRKSTSKTTINPNWRAPPQNHIQKDQRITFLKNIALCSCLPQWCRCPRKVSLKEPCTNFNPSKRIAKWGSTGLLRLILAATPPSTLTTKIDLQKGKRLFPVNFHR